MLLPMGLLEAMINICLALLMVPLVFSRGLSHWIWSAFFLHRMVHDKNIKAELMNTYSEEIDIDINDFQKFKSKEEQLTQAFIGKTVPFIFGVLTTLLTLFLTGKIKRELVTLL